LISLTPEAILPVLRTSTARMITSTPAVVTIISSSSSSETALIPDDSCLFSP
jgi:hypothetical protein